jgi:hypothetical protein
MDCSGSDMWPQGRNASDSPRNSLLLQLSGFFLLCAAYFMWTYSHELGELGGDNAVYLLTAQHFSPWNPHSDIATYFARNSQYPPLYPLILGIFGGGENILAAHIITTLLLLMAIVALYAWQRFLDISPLRASMATLIFSLLPGTYMEALSIHSENLYLLFTLSALALVALFEKNRNEGLLWVAGGCIAAAVLTRSAGISLLVALMIYLLWHRSRNIWPIVLMAVLPVALWHLSGAQRGSGYMALFVEKYGSSPLATLSHQIQAEAMSVWGGWLGNLAASRANSLWVGILGMFCLAGMIRRLYCRKLDGLYVVIYLLLVAIWPFPNEAKRFIFVILPILLVQGMLLAAALPRTTIIVVLIAPALMLTVNRYVQPLPEWAARHRQSQDWYVGDPHNAVTVISSMGLVVDMLRETTKLVPENECIYSIKPSVVALYAQRLSRLPPPELETDDVFHESVKTGGCRYFVLLGGSSPSYGTPLYPLNRLEGKFKALRVANIADPERKIEITVAMLIELEKI